MVERHKACGWLGRLTRSMLTNFLLTEMSNIMLLRDDAVDEDGKCETWLVKRKMMLFVE